MESRVLKPVGGSKNLKIVTIPKNQGHGKIPRDWFNGNMFIGSLTPSEKWVLACLVAFVWRVSYEQKDNSTARRLAYLYREKELLITLMSERTMSEKCNLNRSTVCSAITKLDDFGAVIRIPGKKGKGASNAYILGYESRSGDKGEKRSDHLFSESLILRNGGKIPEDIKETIRRDYDKPGIILWKCILPAYRNYLGTLLFSEISPLVPRREPKMDLSDTQESEDLV
jgi:hypothetical protein